MNKKELKELWIEEQNVAYIKGWHFSHINGRYEEEDDLPWKYEEVIAKYLKSTDTLLDLDTGGGEFLLSLNHPYHLTYATEGYPPNVKLCKEELLPLGIHFKEAQPIEHIPFEDCSIDIIINRHGDYNSQEIARVLKPNGIYISEQVGSHNDRELVDLLLKAKPAIPFPNQTLDFNTKSFKEHGLNIIESQEVFRPIKFYDVGALVWFARIMEWEFPNFSVEHCLNELYEAQEILEKDGLIEGRIHRYLIVAQKQ